MKRKILAISGSTKDDSSNGRLLRILGERHLRTIDLELFEELNKLPHFNPDLTVNPPLVVKKFIKLIDKADGVVICTPEYVFSLPGSLKNAIEWTVSTTVFSQKPVALIVAAASGEKAFEALELIMKTIESRVYDDSMLLIKGIKGKFDEDGTLDEEVKNSLDRIVVSLLKCIEDDNVLATKYREL